MKKTRNLFQFFAATIAFLIFTNVAFADGMLVAPPSKMMMETEQKAIIFYDEGIEHLFLSISFAGDADNFAWIVPTPAQPEVGKSTDRVFERLDELTRPEYPIPEQRYNNTMGGWSTDGAEKSVTVLETKKIEYYDISVLEANNKEALYNWLNDHGYRFPQAGNYIIDEYIQKGWIFTAVKIDDQRFAAGGAGQLQTGHAIPLKLSFSTDKIVYPMKISSVMGLEDDAPEGQVTYIEGAVGKGVQLDTDRMLSTDTVIKDFDITNGMLSFSLKKRDNKALNNVVKIERTSAGGIKEGVRVNNTVGNTYTFNLFTKNVNQRFSVDLGSDFKQNEWQQFGFVWKVNPTNTKKFSVIFYIDDVQRTLNEASSYASNVITNNAAGKNAALSVGGDFFYTMNPTGAEIRSMPPQQNYFVNHVGDILIDEISAASNENKIFSADFREELKVELSNGETNFLRVFEKNVYDDYGWQKSTGTGVLIYVFADKKYEIDGFDIQYAGPIGKEGIMNIAKLEGTNPWIEPKKDDYYLTRMYKFMEYAQMSEDLYPVESEDQGKYNYVGGEKTRFGLVMLLLVISGGSMVGMVMLVLKKERKEKGKKEESGDNKEKADNDKNK